MGSFGGFCRSSLGAASRFTAVVIFFGVLILLFGLFFSDSLLVSRQVPRQADVIVVLDGENVGRTLKALQLYHMGFAPTVLVSGCGDGEIIAQNLAVAGVPRESILIENHSKSTFENASFSLPILNRCNVKTIILVTSWFHSRRATSVFNDISGQISVISVPTDTATFEHLISNKETTRLVLFEYLKIAGYWFIYGISPFRTVSEMVPSSNARVLILMTTYREKPII